MKCCEWGPWGRARTRGRTYVGPERRFDVENDDADENEDDKFKHFSCRRYLHIVFRIGNSTSRRVETHNRNNWPGSKKRGESFLRKLKLLNFVVNQSDFQFFKLLKTFYFHFSRFSFPTQNQRLWRDWPKIQFFFLQTKKFFNLFLFQRLLGEHWIICRSSKYNELTETPLLHKLSLSLPPSLTLSLSFVSLAKCWRERYSSLPLLLCVFKLKWLLIDGI
jgi:hypothetical protein